MKKLFYLFMTALLMVSLNACSDDSDDSKNDLSGIVEAIAPQSTLTFNDVLFKCLLEDVHDNSYRDNIDNYLYRGEVDLCDTTEGPGAITWRLDCILFTKAHEFVKEYIGKDISTIIEQRENRKAAVSLTRAMDNADMFDYFINHKSGEIILEELKYDKTASYYNLRFENYILDNIGQRRKDSYSGRWTEVKSEDDSEYETMTIKGNLKFTVSKW